MGTNYYLHTPACQHCGKADQPLHIGKSSGGWCFSLHVIPEHGINTLDDWRARWHDGIIKDDCGEVITPERMDEIITKRIGHGFDDLRWWGTFYQSEEDFHRLNHSQRGPNSLLRHQLGKLCIGHGDGTYDLLVGDFT